MNTKQQNEIATIFRRWHAEDRELESSMDEVRDWMNEVSQLGIPHFGETATRLRPLRERLVTHFEREDKMVAELAELYPTQSPEVKAVQRQSSRDHDELLIRIDGLIARLEQPEPPFRSWQSAMNEVEMLVGVLEQHEDQEAESIEMLLPAAHNLRAQNDE